MPIVPPQAIQGTDADAAEVANVIDPAALGASQVLPPPPLPPAADLPLDALMAASSAPPTTGTPVDAALAPALPPAGGPALSLVPPPPPEVIAPPTTPDEAAQQNLATAKVIGDEQVANATAKAADDKVKADEEAKTQAAHAAAYEKLVARQEVHRQEAEARTADARAKAEAEPFHTFWETRSIGQNIATGIGLILGGISWNANHVNRGVQLLENMMAQDLQLQKDKHADLWKAVESAEKGETTLDASQLREVARFNAVEAAKHDAVASRLAAAAAMNKGKGDVTEAKKQALKEAETANQFWSLSAHADAAAAHQKEIDAETARHHLEQEKTAALRASKYKTRGGGGGTGKGFEDALTAMQAASDAGKSYGEIVIAGKSLGRKEAEKEAKAIIAARGNQARVDRLEHTMSDKEELRAVRDPDTKKVIGFEGTAPLASKFKTRDVQLGDAANRMHELAADVEKYGAKISPTDIEGVQRRINKFKNAIIAVGIVSPLGKTNETLHLETAVLGPTGTINEDALKKYILSTGAYLPGIKEKEHEMRANRQAYRNTLTPLTSEQDKKYNGGGSGGGGGKPTKIVRPTSGPYKGKEVRVDDEGNIFL